MKKKYDVCKQCSYFYSAVTDDDKKLHFYGCITDVNSVKANGNCDPNRIVKNFESTEVPSTCLFKTEQCLSNWNDNGDKKKI